MVLAVCGRIIACIINVKRHTYEFSNFKCQTQEVAQPLLALIIGISLVCLQYLQKFTFVYTIWDNFELKFSEPT